MAWYKQGTISVTNGSATVTGSGTQWIANAAIGEALYAPDGRLYEIINIASNTSFTITPNYLGTTQSGQTYTIVPSQSFIRDLAAQAADLVNQYSTIANTVGVGKFADGTAGTPGIRFNDDPDTGLYRIGANILGVSAGGGERIRVTTTGAAVTGILSGTAVTQTTTDTTANRLMKVGDFGLGNSASGVSLGSTFNFATDLAPTGLYHYASSTNPNAPESLAFFHSLLAVRTGETTRAAYLSLRTSATDPQLFIGGKDASNLTWARVFNNNTSSTITTTATQTFGTNNTERMRIDTSGNVGIGTSSPAFTLDVSGTTRSTNVLANTIVGGASAGITYTGLNQIVARGTGNSGFVVDSGTTSLGRFAFGDGALVGYVEYSHADDSMRFATNSAVERMRINASGNVGIGTNDPTTRLHINGTGAGIRVVSSDNVTPNITFERPAGASYQIVNDAGSFRIRSAGASATPTFDNNIYLASSTVHAFSTSGTERMRIDSSGNVGIGTTSPPALLSVVRSADGEIARFQRIGGTNIPILRVNLTDSTNIAEIEHTGSNVGSLAFRTAGGERMRIDSSGNVLVGQSSTTTPGLSNTTAGLSLRGSGEVFASVNNSAAGYFNRNTDDGTLVTFRRQGINVGSVSVTTTEATFNGALNTPKTAVTSPAATDGNVFSGTYTPTLTNTTNVSSSTAFVCQYMRVGNVVTVSGRVDITPTAISTTTILQLTVPVASNFTSSENARGTSSLASGTAAETGNGCGAVYSESSSQLVNLRHASTTTGSRSHSFTFTYRIL